MKTINKICLVLLLLPFFTVNAQDDPQISQHLSVRSQYNPAATGASTYGNITIIGRHQFMGFEGAPATALLNFDLLVGANSGLGLSVKYDTYGPLINYNALANYSFHLKTGEKQYLSFGLGAGIEAVQYDASNNIYEADGDPYENYDEDMQFRPDVNFGLEYHLDKWMIGASVTHLQSFFYDEDIRFSSPNYYAYTRYRFEPGRDWDIIPSLSGFYDNYHVHSEVDLQVSYLKALWFGAAFRMSDVFEPEAIVPRIGFYITDFVRIGYAYDYNLSGLSTYSEGTHEILLTIRFRTKGDTFKTPRFSEW